jgi:RimJ/RimL family protein N-acetyltransferase
MADLFHSARLTYRAIESPADDAFIHSIRLDSASSANATLGLLRPPSEKTSAERRAKLVDETLIGVVICLKPTDPELGSPSASSPLTPPTHNPAPVPIGYICLGLAVPSRAHYRSANIWLEIVRAYQGKGYGSEAIRWVLWWGFEMAGLHRIDIGAVGWNEGALRLYERLGFVFEGRKREAVWYRGAWWDLVDFGLLEGEWRALVAKEGKKQ